MGLRLNAISDTDAAAALDRAEREIARLEEAGPDESQRRVASAAPRYYELLAEAYFRAGTLCYQQQRPIEHVAHYLHFAGVRMVEELERRGDPTESTNRDFYSMIERNLGLVACFCPHEYRQRLSSIHESRYHWPHDPKWTFQPSSREQPRLLHSYYRLHYMRAAVEALATGTVNVALVQGFIRELDAEDRHIPEREEAIQGYWALMAIADGNSGFFHQRLESLALAHGALASTGRLRTRPEGLLFFNGLLLGRLAREREMSVSLRSAFVPLSLIG